MIRFIFIALFLVLYLILSCPIMLILLLVRKINAKKADIIMQRIVQCALSIVWHMAGVKLTTLGLDNIPDDQAVLFVGNHQSFFDVIISYSQMKRQTAYIAKKSFQKWPLLSWNMLFLHCLFLDRENLRQGVKTIMTAAEMAREDGISIFIFPEGTRNKGEESELAPFHDGSFKVAQRGKVPIIPVSFNNTAAVFEQHLPKIKPQHVVIEYGRPVFWDELTKEEKKRVGEHYREILTEMVVKNKELV